MPPHAPLAAGTATVSAMPTINRSVMAQRPASRPRVSVVMPVYNVEAYVAEAIDSVLAQDFADWELIIVDDGGQDRSLEICRCYADPRIRIISQPNRGLAGARNTGIAAARGDYIALLDSDDRFLPEKLALHVIHLDARPEVGVSYCPSRFIDAEGQPMRLVQRPRLDGIDAATIFCRNPVGNGSAAVLRTSALDRVRFFYPDEPQRPCWFDESLRQSEDIEMWLRLAVAGGVTFEGIGMALTEYRVQPGGLSAQVLRHYQSWLGVVARLDRHAPGFVAAHVGRARAYQLRYLARRAVQMGDPRGALGMLRSAFASSVRPLIEEPVRSLITVGAAVAGVVLGPARLGQLIRLAAGGKLVS